MEEVSLSQLELSMATDHAKMGEMNPTKKAATTLVFIQVSLRLLAFAAAIAATLVTTMSKETVVIFGLTVEAKYSYSPAFKFFAAGNAIASAYALLSAPFASILSSRASVRNSDFFLFLFDLMVMGLLISSVSAATATGYLSKKGNSHTGWAPVCDHLEKYCEKVASSIFCSVAAAILYFLIVLASALKAKQIPFSRY
ncbi:hypothetical protein ACLOJK_002186 [Asimina triloba]